MENDDIMKNYIKGIVEEVVEEKCEIVKKEDAEVIIQEIIPHLDKLISKKVKQHLCFLADKLKTSFEE